MEQKPQILWLVWHLIFSQFQPYQQTERLFSSSKHVLRDTRNRLKCDTLEARECLKSWAKEGVLLSNFYRLNTFSEPDLMVDNLSV